jgi:hypothetical protein
LELVAHAWGLNVMRPSRGQMISMGGKMSYVSLFQKESYSSFKSEGWDVSAAASLSFAAFTGSASVDVSEHAADYRAFTEARSSTQTVCIGAGGKCAPQSPDQDPSTWVDAVQDSPLPLVYQLQDLPSLLTSDFFPDDPDIDSRRQALTAFLTDHYCGENQACKPVVPSKDGYWSAVASVSCAGYAGQLRVGATAAGVGSRVFLSGGEGDDGASAAACAWSQGSNAWAALPGMATARAYHAVVTLADPYSAGGRLVVATGGRQAAASEWPLDRTLQGHISAVMAVAVSPDGRSIVSGSYDFTITVWSRASGECLRTLQGHTKTVWSVAVSPDGQFIVSGSFDLPSRCGRWPAGSASARSRGTPVLLIPWRCRRTGSPSSPAARTRLSRFGHWPAGSASARSRGTPALSRP